MHPNRRLWRRVLAADISITMLAVFFFALLPPNTLNVVELSIMVGAAASAAGVVSYAFDWLRLPGERWGYLLAGMVCLMTLLSYEVATVGSPIPLSIRIPFGLFLAAGTASSLAAHIIDGARPAQQRGGSV